MDYNDHRPDTALGSVSFALDVLEQDATQEDISRPILKDGHERGQLLFEVNFYPVITPSKTSEGTVQKLPQTSSSRSVPFLGAAEPFCRRWHCTVGTSPGQGPRQLVGRSKPVCQGLPRQ